MLYRVMFLFLMMSPIYANSQMPENIDFIETNSEMLAEFDYYKQHFALKDIYSKLVDNAGNGYENLYGVRNFRAVLHGVYYRGGANNAYNKYGKRNNQNPLPNLGLNNLCAENFGIAIYYYPTNYKNAPHVIDCKAGTENNTLNYLNYPALNSKNHELILELIYKRTQGLISGPIYGHCWNGWHASGLMAALSLRQFCDFSEEAAISYWVKNTDGNSKGYDKIKAMIRNFKPLSKFKISTETKQVICP